MALLHGLPAYRTIYYLLWTCAYFVVATLSFRRAFRETLALKRENDWFVGEKRVIQSDLRVAQLKKRRSAPVALFAIPSAMSVGLMVWMVREGSDFIGIGVAATLITVLFLLVALGTRRAKARVYSMNSDVNVSLKQARRRAWSYLWLVMAIIENIHFALIYQAAANGSEGEPGVWLAITLAFTAIPLGSIVYVHRKVRALEQELLGQDDKVVYGR